jgi:hypothetical protein
MDFLISSLITGLISVFTAFIILGLQEWRNKKKLLQAVHSEIGSNLSLAKKITPLAEYISASDKTKECKGTKFDLQSFHVSSYESFRLSGHLLSLKQKTRELLEEVYVLISSHNSQTEMLKNQQIDFSSYEAIIATLAPRIGGYVERLKVLTEKLQLLQDEFGA